MTRLFCLAIVLLAVGLLAASAWASVPYPPNCTVTWYRGGTVVDDSTVIVCPKGDASYFDVTVKDQLNAPMSGVTAYATFTLSDGQLVVWSCTGVTNAVGYARLPIKASVHYDVGWAVEPHALNATEGPVTVYAAGVPLWTEGHLKYYISPDANASGTVLSDDYTMFTNDWQFVFKQCHSNYNRTDPASVTKTNSVDYTVWTQHYLHTQ
jgi:hypothetical protein